jgi:hypothetical protein
LDVRGEPPAALHQIQAFENERAPTARSRVVGDLLR